MEWPAVLALILAIPLILVPVILVWFLNIKGVRDLFAQRRKQFAKVMKKRGQLGGAVLLAAGVYAVLIWFFLGRYGWPAALATALVLPIVLAVPFLVWASVASGLSQVFFDRMRRRAAARRRAGIVTVPHE